jgi:aryl-alcohol dehydrogenase-like predicted oxidoreductase
MEFKPLGHSGLTVSSVGIGCMNFGAMCDQATTDAIVGTALEAGVNFFDVADIYGPPQAKSETLLGKALAQRRGSIVLATKFGAKTGGRGGAAEGGGSRAYIMQAVEQSLARLGTDYIDLYQHHFPDTGTAIEETLRALEELVQQGKVRHIGSSNYSAEQLQAAASAARTLDMPGFCTAQNRYSLLQRDIEAALVPVAQGDQVGILPYFPLESGLLSGKYREGEPAPADTRFGKWGGGGGFVSPARWAAMRRLQHYADGIGRSVLDLAIGWLAAQPFVSSVIAGVTRPEQVTQNVAAASWPLSAEQVVAIGRLADPAAVH